MLDNNLIQTTSSWPFVEVRKLLKDRKEIIRKKEEKLPFKQVTVQAAYHTLVLLVKSARTSMMINALNILKK